MDLRSRIPSIERRLDQVEHEVHILQENQAALERTVALLEARGAAAAPERPRAVPEVIFSALTQAVARQRDAGKQGPPIPEAAGPNEVPATPPEAWLIEQVPLVPPATASPVSMPATSYEEAPQPVPGGESEPVALTFAEPLPGELSEVETAEPAEPPVLVAPEPPRARPSFDFLGKSEFWLNKVGIGLLLLGLAYFFKYSIDKGWLNEPVRIGLGLALGTVLLVTGLAFHAQRRHFSQVLLGGSIATYYITGFAAYELFRLVPYEWAFGFMAVVTALAFGLAVRQDEAILALIGVAGGLLTPFVLTGPAANVGGLMLYTCVVLAGAGAIYFFRGWRSLLWLSVAGGWAVFLLGWQGTVGTGQVATADRWALQGAALFGLLAFWAVPVLRADYVARHPERESRPLFAGNPDLARLAADQVYLLVIGVPLITLAFSRFIWGSQVTQPVWGWWTLAGTLVYAAVAWALRRRLLNLAYTHGMMAILLGTLSLVQILEGNALLFALAVEGTALLVVARRLADRGTAVYGHVVWAGAVTWLAINLAVDLGTWLFFGSRYTVRAALSNTALTNLAVIGLLAAASFALGATNLRALYRNIVHFAFVVWLGLQLAGLPYAVGWTMLAWAVYAVLLNVAYKRLPARFTIVETTLPAHAVLAAGLLFFGIDMSSGQAGSLAVFNVKTLLDLAFLAILGGMSFVVRPAPWATAYRLFLHLGVIGLLARELAVLPHGVGYIMLAWAVYAAGLNVLHYRWPVRFPDDDTTNPAHLIFLLAAIWFSMDIYTGHTGSLAVFNVQTLIDAIGVAIVAGMSFFARPARLVPAYRIAAHAGVLALLGRELGVLPDGSGYVLLAWAAYLTFAQYLAWRGKDLITAGGTHAGFLLVAAGLAQRLWDDAAGPLPLVNLAALIDLAVIALILGTSWLAQPRVAAWAYRLVAHVALLYWFWRELVTLENGQALVTIAWGVYALAVVVGGLWGRRRMPLVYAGLATLFVVLGKLFLIDLAAIDPLWRVLLFLGFGGVFLWLSYFFQNAISGKSRPPGARGFGRLHWPGRPAH